MPLGGQAFPLPQTQWVRFPHGFQGAIMMGWQRSQAKAPTISVTETKKFRFIDQKLEERRQRQQFRELQPYSPHSAVHHRTADRLLVNFSANDYLGLSKHPALIAAAQSYAQQYGTGSAASRLVTGTYTIHQALEQKLAAACNQEAALLFSSGFQTNSTVLPALLDRSSLVFCDRLIHNSLIQGILASRARFVRYRHNDLSHLEQLLQQAAHHSNRQIMIVSETVFSMDGDRSDVDKLAQLAQAYDALLYVDDAHAIGVMGQQGMGLAVHQPGIDLVVGTFGKAFGSFGAFVACTQKLRDYLVNYCPGFIYTTALPPPVIGAIDAALDLIPMLDQERHILSQHAERFRAHLRRLHYSTGDSSSQIVPLIVGSEDRALHLSQWLSTQGFLATAIRPPTVAAGTTRLRFAFSSQHTVEQVNALMQAIEDWHGRSN